ncbi:peptidylprolyl isomerase [Candidatus Micrarchaeota archaeon]|nr:peptidylprolyl isomerase [Candidatus Micrarchaeota archaeon]
MEKIQNNDFIKVSYTAKKASTNEIFETTDENAAKEAKIHSEDSKYGPALIVVGRKHMVPGIEEALTTMTVGEEKTIEVSPEKAYGNRRADLVRLMPVAQFRRNNIDPYPGLVLNLDGISATVKSVNSGRVTIDLNHPMAGEKLTYQVKINEKLKTEEDKVKALLEESKLNGTITIEKTKLELKVDPKLLNNENYFANKTLFLNLVKTLIPEFKKLIVIEEYENEEKA